MVNSLLDKYILEPFNQSLENMKIKSNIYIQLSFFILFLIFYYFSKNKYNICTVLLTISYFLFSKYISVNNDKNDKLLFEMLFLLVTFTIIFLNSYNKKIDISTNIFILIFALFILISYSIKNKNIQSKNKNLYFWNNLKNNIVNYLYPQDYDNIINYHYNKFWKLFDFNLLVIILNILLIYS